MSQYDKLKELALAATQGEWWIDSHGHQLVSHNGMKAEIIFTVSDTAMPAVRHEDTGNLSHWRNDNDASYIAAVNPAAILALIAQRDELLAALKMCAAVCAGESLNKRDLIDALEAAREAIETWQKLCAHNPGEYVDIVSIRTEIIMNQGTYHLMERHFNPPQGA